MDKLPQLGFFKLLEDKKTIQRYRIASISTILILISILLQPAPVDMIFVLLIESLCLIVIMVLSYFLLMHLGILVLGVLTGVVLVPLLLLFLWTALMFITMILGFGAMTGEASPYELINYSIQILDGDWQNGVQSVINYFGTDLYWIAGGMLVHHFLFDIILYYKSNISSTSKKERENKAMDLFFHFTSKAMIQSSVIMLFALCMAIPLLILALLFSSQLWIAYIVIILFRIGLEYNSKLMAAE